MLCWALVGAKEHCESRCLLMQPAFLQYFFSLIFQPNSFASSWPTVVSYPNSSCCSQWLWAWRVLLGFPGDSWCFCLHVLKGHLAHQERKIPKIPYFWQQAVTQLDCTRLASGRDRKPSACLGGTTKMVLMVYSWLPNEISSSCCLIVLPVALIT